MTTSETRRQVSIRWRDPLRAAHNPEPQARADRQLTVVTLDDGDHQGFGESAWLPGYAGVTVSEAERAGTDLAHWDLCARRAGVPLWQHLGAAKRPVVEVNATIGAELPETAAVSAAAAAREGYRTIKVKVGLGSDGARLAAIREAVGDHVELRLDANGAWNVEQAIAALEALRQYRPELCEEPVHGAEGLAQVAAASEWLPIVADESASELLQQAHDRDQTRCDGVCLKIARGGITQLLEDAQLARRCGYSVYLASTLDGPLGIAAAVHAAGVIEPERPCGLATLDRFAREPPLPIVDGRLAAPDGPGLGDGLLDWYGED